VLHALIQIVLEMCPLELGRELADGTRHLGTGAANNWLL
jgi:hypothetical protein